MSIFKSSRDKYIPNKCIRNPSVLKFCEIMNGKNTSLLNRIAKFAGLICNFFLIINLCMCDVASCPRVLVCGMVARVSWVA